MPRARRASNLSMREPSSHPSTRSFALAPSLGWLNVFAVGFSLAACTAATLGMSFPAIAVGMPTLVLGLVWSYWMRRHWASRSWLPWLAAAPLAALNAGLAFATVVVVGRGGTAEITDVVLALVYGTTIGAILWLPALAATLVAFGLPMLHAQVLARRGLAAGERGEAFVGQACAVLSAAALALAVHVFGAKDAWGRGFTAAVALVGAGLGVTSWLAAWTREWQRRRFVASVERGEQPSFRVEKRAEGATLVRVAPVTADPAAAYRAADVREEICRLDLAGRATEPRRF